MTLIYLILLLALIAGPLFFRRSRMLEASPQSVQRALPGVQHQPGWDMPSLKADPSRVEQLRGWVAAIRVTWSQDEGVVHHRVAGGYLDPAGPSQLPPVFHSAFIDTNGAVIKLDSSQDYQQVLHDAHWLASTLNVPLEDQVNGASW